MVKYLLIKCCGLIGRDDLIDELKNANSIDDILKNDVKNDIYKLISYFNFIITTLFENYLKLEFCEKVTSDALCEIDYHVLTYRPIEILKVEDTTFSNAEYMVKTNFILTKCAKKDYFVTYRYVPLNVHDINENFILPKNLSDKIICYGIIKEFLASKGKFQESEYFSDKFMYEIFKLKTSKEKKLRKTFCI